MARPAASTKLKETKPAPEKLSRVERKRQQKMHDIVVVAADILAQKGYLETSFEAIAERIDVTKATLYHYFPSKDALVLDALRYVSNRSIARFEAVEAQHPDPVERLRALIVEYLTIINLDYAEGAQVAFRAFEWPDAILPSIKALRERHDLPFRRTIEEGIQAGRLKVANPSIARHCMHGAIAYSKVWLRGNKTAIRQGIQEVADNVMRLFDAETP